MENRKKMLCKNNREKTPNFLVVENCDENLIFSFALFCFSFFFISCKSKTKTKNG